MSKFALLAVLAVLAVAQGYPQKEVEISDAASNGDWNLVHKLIQQRFENQRNLWEPSLTIPTGNVRSLKPLEGGHVYGESEYTFRSESNVNGKKTESKGGHRVVNKDGVVTEYDIEPKF
ncbi:uncharacterized protein LOC135086714 [Ostrinia nubilalis]|uniref:Seroin transcript 3 n=1 Tax=Ostrinia nubilalis TaxID=29057 RepID=A0A455LAN9_OSTNU|nr:uncharacterized protein LOC114363584 [Ostrinia furnacalis]AXY94663.1 seroin transcript 3 [Ostrinia nubilalis]